MNTFHLASILMILNLPLASLHIDTAPLIPGRIVVVPGGPGAFDWMMFDAPRQRLIASHPGKNELVVYDLNDGKVSQLKIGAKVNGEAIDEADHLLFAAGGGGKLFAFNLDHLTRAAELTLNGPADAIAFDPKNGLLYADHDDGSEVWTIDPKRMKVTGSVAIAGAPEYLQYDPKLNMMYQNIKQANETDVIDPNTNKVVASWPTSPVTSPHGLAVDILNHRVFCAGQGKIVELNAKNGTVIDSKDIAPGYVDQIAFDPYLKRIYCASIVGSITVLRETHSGLTLLGMVPVTKKTHTLAIDPNSHAVWVSSLDDTKSFFQELIPNTDSEVAN